MVQTETVDSTNLIYVGIQKYHVTCTNSLLIQDRTTYIMAQVKEVHSIYTFVYVPGTDVPFEEAEEDGRSL